MAAVGPGSAKPTLHLHTSRENDTVVVKCSGRLIAEFTRGFKDQVQPLVSTTKRVVLDLSELAYMDSSGLGAIVSVYVSAKRHGCELQLINFNKQIRELLGLTHLLSAFETCGQYMIRMP